MAWIQSKIGTMVGEMTRIAGGLLRHGCQLHFTAHLFVALLLIGATQFIGATSVEALMLSGSYPGNGTDNRAITGLKFQPDVVIIKASNSAQEAVIRTSSMSGDLSKPMGGPRS